jgi:hypothetical protein
VTTLTDFLLARIAEDEAHCRMVLSRSGPWDAPPISPERVLAECEAKRRIVQGVGVYGGRGSDEAMYHEVVLSFLALPYADHPDYREEWRP